MAFEEEALLNCSNFLMLLSKASSHESEPFTLEAAASSWSVCHSLAWLRTVAAEVSFNSFKAL